MIITSSGPATAIAYYKHDDPYDSKAFFKLYDGSRWFRSGDIGRINLETNSIQIVDRKKLLIKLQNGEHVAMGRVDSILAQSRYVERSWHKALDTRQWSGHRSNEYQETHDRKAVRT